MQKSRWFIFALIGLLFILPVTMVLVSCGDDDDDDNNDDNGGGTLIPLTTGATWNYKLTVPNAKVLPYEYYQTIVNMGPMTKDGVSCYKAQSTYTGEPDVESHTDETYFVNNQDNIDLFMNDIMYSGSGYTSRVSNVYNPHQMLYPSMASLATTSSWTSSGSANQKIYIDGQMVHEFNYEYSTEMTLLGQETKTVTAGTFNNCYKFSHRFILKESGDTIIDSTDTIWVAPGVGNILSDNPAEGVTRELQSYSGV